MKYQRGCDTWQVTAKIAQPCIFLTKSHECTVNCAISSQNFSNHYIITDHPSPISRLSLLSTHPPSPGWAYCPLIPHLQDELTVHPSPISKLSFLFTHPPSPVWAYWPSIPHLQAELTDHPSPSWALLSTHPPSLGWAYWPSIPHLQAALTDHPSPISSAASLPEHTSLMIDSCQMAAHIAGHQHPIVESQALDLQHNGNGKESNKAFTEWQPTQPYRDQRMDCPLIGPGW